MGHDLGSNLDQFDEQGRERPVLHRARQSQTAKEVADVVCQCEELEPDLIVVEVVARKPRLVHRVLSLLDPLLRNAPTIVELDHVLVGTLEIGHNEAYARQQLAQMPVPTRNPIRGVVACVDVIPWRSRATRQVLGGCYMGRAGCRSTVQRAMVRQ